VDVDVWGGSSCTAETPTCTGAEKEMVLNASGFCPQLGQLSHTPAPSEQQVHSKVSLSVVLWTPCSGVEWGVFEPTIRVWRSGTTGKQPANLAVEAAEESLSILPDYPPTVRPPPKRP
jgi:hypothetical protein